MFIVTGWGRCGFRAGTANRGIAVVTAHGTIKFGYRTGEESDPKSLYCEPISEWYPRFYLYRVPFCYQRGDVLWGHPPRRNLWVQVPLWLPLLVIALPTMWLWFTDRAKPWQCPKCRYDLRGLDGGVCPECGAKNAVGNNH